MPLDNALVENRNALNDEVGLVSPTEHYGLARMVMPGLEMYECGS